MRRQAFRLLLPLLVLAGCGGSNPAELGPGSASVRGTIYDTRISPIPNIRISVACGAAETAVTAADSTGQYGINLSVNDSLMTATRGNISCEFSASQASGARLDTSVTIPFGVDGSPQSLKFIDLYLH